MNRPDKLCKAHNTQASRPWQDQIGCRNDLTKHIEDILESGPARELRPAPALHSRKFCPFDFVEASVCFFSSTPKMASDPVFKETTATVSADSPEMAESDGKSNNQPSPAVKAKNLAATDTGHDGVAASTASARGRVEIKPVSTDNGHKTPSIPISASKPAKQPEVAGNDMPVYLQALADAETARLKGNHAYSNGRLGDAIAIYTMADHLLTAASETEDGQSTFHFSHAWHRRSFGKATPHSAAFMAGSPAALDPAYHQRKQACLLAIRLNATACYLKLGQHQECLAACNAILKVTSIAPAPGSRPFPPPAPSRSFRPS
jgi:hypothetical protein